jgi:hypothetical protein
MRQENRYRGQRRLGVRSAVIAGIAATACCLFATPTLAQTGPVSAARVSGKPAVAQTGPVSPIPVSGTPTLTTTGTTEQIRQLVQCGGNMFAVGTFTSITWNGQTYPRNNIFEFSATEPFTVSPWNPDVNGTVNTIAFNDGNCADAYIGGQFTSVGGAAAKNIAEIDTTVGALVSGFKDNASGAVETILAVDGHLLTGGRFKGINGSSADPYYASLSPTTGKNDGFLDLDVSGHYVYHAVRDNSTEVYNQQLSPNGTLDLVEGDFTSVGGLPRQQIFMINVSGTTATVTGWSSPQWDGSDPSAYPYWQCGDSHPFYIQAAAWSPDGSTIYIADTGYKPVAWNGVLPLPSTELCDLVAAFPSTQQEVTDDWINFDGCNSMYSVAADSSAVYAGGHERWADDQDGCKHAGPGYINAPGMGGFNPSTGALLLNSAGTAGLYSRSRGHGADDMLLTGAGLWIASDNFDGGTSCGGEAGFSGICFLPYPSGS